MSHSLVAALAEVAMALFSITIFIYFGFVHCIDEDLLMKIVQEKGYMAKGDAVNYGPEMPDTTYKPGEPGAGWMNQKITT